MCSNHITSTKKKPHETAARWLFCVAFLFFRIANLTAFFRVYFKLCKSKCKSKLKIPPYFSGREGKIIFFASNFNMPLVQRSVHLFEDFPHDKISHFLVKNQGVKVFIDTF